ncbi:MAG: flagellar hook assembly protein FlgD [Rhodobiaceae bacterium]|nr:flagellar hook assembly protein FlgD [Rhodobiaceae bacterium]
MELTGLGALSGIGDAVKDRNSIADNFDTFLQILTTQLKNQNPLEPMDTNEFTNQLVQFSSVEQAVKTNENLETLLRINTASMATAAVSYIGKSITAQGVTSTLENGTASWSYSATKPVDNAFITIRDKNGSVVFSEERSLTKANGVYTWDGRRSDGAVAAGGTYTISITGSAADGTTIPVKTAFGGVVNGVDLTGTEPILLVGERRVNLSSVQSIGQNTQ